MAAPAVRQPRCRRRSKPAELPADAIEVGRIADAWGIKGWFKVLPHSADPQALFSSKRWYLQPTGEGPKDLLRDGAAARARSQGTLGHRWWRAPTASTTARRRSLRGARIFVPRSSFPTADKDEYYGSTCSPGRPSTAKAWRWAR
jgi:16S rRNA processing protein RimM